MNYAARRHRCWPIVSVLLLLIATSRVAFSASETDTAVVYPELKAPYNAVIEAILRGVESTRPVTAIPLTSSQDPDALLRTFRDNNINNVVILGRGGQRIAQQLSRELHVINAAVFAAPESSLPNVATVTMIPDAATLFDALQTVNPNVRRAYVIYGSNTGQWQVDRAREKARTLPIQLIAKRVADVQEASLTYKELLESGLNENDAIWLAHDSAIEDPALLEFLLDASWKQRFTLFSSNTNHVKRGALFATFPDNFQMGVQVGQLLNSAVDFRLRSTPTTYTAHATSIAVNDTTAKHLGLQFSASQQNAFAVRFPSGQ